MLAHNEANQTEKSGLKAVYLFYTMDRVNLKRKHSLWYASYISMQYIESLICDTIDVLGKCAGQH